MIYFFLWVIAVFSGSPPPARQGSLGFWDYLLTISVIAVIFFFYLEKYKQDPSDMFISAGLCTLGLRDACAPSTRTPPALNEYQTFPRSTCLPKRPNLSGPRVMVRAASSTTPFTHRVNTENRRVAFRDGNSTNHWEIGELTKGSCIRVESETRFWSEIVLQDCDGFKTFFTESVNLQKLTTGERC
jgi:hypothetical protein